MRRLIHISHTLCVYLVPFLSYSELFVENRKTVIPRVYLSPFGMTPLEFYQGIRSPRLSRGVVCMVII